jgi:predicted small lipoprotein YifL
MSGRALIIGAAISLALGLAACGRKGPLDLPPSDTPSPQANNNLTQPSFGPSSMMPGVATAGDRSRAERRRFARQCDLPAAVQEQIVHSRSDPGPAASVAVANLLFPR